MSLKILKYNKHKIINSQFTRIVFSNYNKITKIAIL